MKKLLAVILAVALALTISACNDTAPLKDGSAQDNTSQEEPTVRRKERKENEEKAKEEGNIYHGEGEESESYDSPWKDYVEPQLDTGMGRVFPTLESPAGATSMFVRYYRDWDMLGVAKCISDYGDYNYYEWNNEPQDLYDGLMARVLAESQFSILSEEINGDTAVVRIQCKAFSGEVIMDLYAESLIQAGLYDFYEAYDDKILKSMNFNFVPYIKVEADAHLIKCPDGLWRLDAYSYENEAVINALTGNLTGIVDDYYADYYFDKYYGGWYDDWDYGRNKDQDTATYDEWYRNWYKENFGQEKDEEA